MQITVASVRVLHQIYCLQRDDVRATRAAIATALGEPLTAIDQAFQELLRAGLVADALRPRLTFPGLAVAAAASPRSVKHASEKPPALVGPRLGPAPVVKALPRGAYPVRRARSGAARPAAQRAKTQTLLEQSLLLLHV